MCQFYTFWVTSRARCVAKKRAVTWFALIKRLNPFDVFPLLDYVFEAVKFNTHCIACGKLSRCRFIKSNQILDRMSKAFFLHGDNFRNVFRCSKNAWKLCLVQNEVDSLYTHRIEESDCSHWVVHICNMSCEPLPPVFGPNPDEMPLFSIAFCLDC